MKISVNAYTPATAKSELLKRLNEVKIHEIRENRSDDDIINFFNDIFNGKAR